MNSTEKIASEFSNSMNKAIDKIAKEQECEQAQIQIALELTAKEENAYKVCKNFAFVKSVKLNDILFLNPIYSLFKGQIAGKIKECLVNLAKQEQSNFVTVFIMKSKLPGKVRMMLYVKGTYKSEMTAEQIISLNN